MLNEAILVESVNGFFIITILGIIIYLSRKEESTRKDLENLKQNLKFARAVREEDEAHQKRMDDFFQSEKERNQEFFVESTNKRLALIEERLADAEDKEVRVQKLKKKIDDLSNQYKETVAYEKVAKENGFNSVEELKEYLC